MFCVSTYFFKEASILILYMRRMHSQGWWSSRMFSFFYFPLQLVSEEGWLSRCPLDMAWCKIFLNELKGGLPPCDSAVCQAQITQWEEHQCCQFTRLSLTLAPAASVNSPRASPFPSLDSTKTAQPNIWGLVTKFNSFVSFILNILFQRLELNGVPQTTRKCLTEIE